MTLDEAMATATHYMRAGWIFKDQQEKYHYIVSGFDHYCGVGYVPVCRVDVNIDFVHMQTGVIL